jgi:hypothetical protein
VKLQIWSKPKVAEEPEAEAEPEGPCAMVQVSQLGHAFACTAVSRSIGGCMV